MRTEITRATFDERDYARFRDRLEQCLPDLGRVTDAARFGALDNALRRSSPW